MENKTYDKLIEELKQSTLKLSSNEITMQEAMKIFEDNIAKINQAKEMLTAYEGSVNKVLEDNQIKDFE
ncbi:exodeoxyribonuclease VII small subunit [Entomoplasma ellychniae]|uniref:Exodeoxyribonuclease VII small subunit n=2 Tax=Entomoplasmataceae TaxID=33925 RepID=A0A2S5RG76_9MOLU|nr:MULTISPECIES: exodeoxyribonuclease VII small subunit [Entomoplasmataceae]PPE04564.1 exodeoxyribonuclease VII small subunit [Entomoplasma ellychniae]PPE06336.1 exodeoxyribonuclease VII small subunit [Mesoplasma corruscae]